MNPRRVNHIVERDHGTHVNTLCGMFPKTVEEAMDGVGVCKSCKKKFAQSKEQLEAYRKYLVRLGESFKFDKAGNEI